MKYYLLLGLLIFTTLAIGQQEQGRVQPAEPPVATDRPVGTVERLENGATLEFKLPSNCARVDASAAYERVYLTTDTVTTHMVTRFLDNGQSLPQVASRVETRLQNPTTWTLRLKPDHFISPTDGGLYRHLSPGEVGYTTPTTYLMPYSASVKPL